MEWTGQVLRHVSVSVHGCVDMPALEMTKFLRPHKHMNVSNVAASMYGLMPLMVIRLCRTMWPNMTAEPPNFHFPSANTSTKHLEEDGEIELLQRFDHHCPQTFSCGATYRTLIYETPVDSEEDLVQVLAAAEIIMHTPGV